MRTQDSFELKVLRALLPLIIYYGVQLVVQAIFGIYAMWYKFVDIGQSDTRHYLLGYQYFDNIQEYLQQHSLVILFLAAVITCPILLLISRRSSEADMHWEPAGIRASGIILFFGIFTSGALGKSSNTSSAWQGWGRIQHCIREFFKQSIAFPDPDIMHRSTGHRGNRFSRHDVRPAVRIYQRRKCNTAFRPDLWDLPRKSDAGHLCGTAWHLSLHSQRTLSYHDSTGAVAYELQHNGIHHDVSASL